LKGSIYFKQSMLTEKSKKLANAISNSLQLINSSKNVRYINQSNYDQLGTFHKMFLTNIGKMLRVVDKDGDLEYETFVKIVSNMFDMKTDLEKQYIW
jgi:hypothetical protein